MLLCYFNPLPSHEGRLHFRAIVPGQFVISIHSLLTKGDNTFYHAEFPLLLFQSTPFSRRETSPQTPSGIHGVAFQSTPFSRRETTEHSVTIRAVFHFNPLPSHEGRLETGIASRLKGYFNPLPSHEGRRQPLPVFHPILPHFIIHIDRITSLSPSNSSVCAHIFRKLHYSSPVRISRCFCVHLGFAPRSLFQSAMAQTLPGS